MPKTQSQSFQDFRKELIRRFFNPRSYFFLCLSTQLQDVDHIAADISEDDYLLIGQVMQRLVDSPHPERELAAFQILTRFQDFHHTLEESLHHLYQPGLAPDEMKQIIEGLAHDFVEVLIDVLHDPVEKKRLLGLMHMDQPLAETAPLTDAKIMELNESVVENLDDMPGLVDQAEPINAAPAEAPASTEEGPSRSDPSPADSVIIEETQSGTPEQAELEATDSLVLDAFEDQNGQDELPGPDTAAEPAEDAPSEVSEAETNDAVSPTREKFGAPESDVGGTESEATDTAAPVSERADSAKKAVDAPSMRLELQQEFPSESLAEDLLAVPDAQNAPSDEPQSEKPVTTVESNQRETEPAIPIAEPEGLASLFAREIQSLVDTVREAAGQCQEGRFPQKALKELRRALLDIRESAMIHGYQEVEDMAQKGQSLVDRLRRERKPLTGSLVALLQDFPAKIEAAMQIQKEPQQEQVVRDFIQALNKALLAPYAFEYEAPQDSTVDLEQIEEQQAAREMTEPPQGTAEKADSSEKRTARASEEANIEPADDALAEAELPNPFDEADWDFEAEPVETIGQETPAVEFSEPPTEEPIDLLEEVETASPELDDESFDAGEVAASTNGGAAPAEDLTLPGEDDPELMQLIQEVAGHRASAGDQQPDESPTAEPPKSALQDYLRALANFSDVPEGASVEATIREFLQGAKLYFRVASEALAQLEKSPQDRLAWENLELTCYSLKGLAQKLGLDQLARLPGYVEELASLVLQHSYLIDQSVLVDIAKALTILSEIADKQDTEASHFQEAEKAILRNITEMQKRPSEPTAKTPVASDAESDASVEPRRGQLRLRGKEGARTSPQAEPQNEPLSNPVENLDFLMNDDSDLLGLDD